MIVVAGLAIVPFSCNELAGRTSGFFPLDLFRGDMEVARLKTDMDVEFMVTQQADDFYNYTLWVRSIASAGWTKMEVFGNDERRITSKEVIFGFDPTRPTLQIDIDQRYHRRYDFVDRSFTKWIAW